jgi:hypothetical protein
MSIEAILPWADLGLGAMLTGSAYASWRKHGSPDRALSGLMFMALAVSMLTSGWVRDAAWVVLAVGGVRLAQRALTERRPVLLWIGLFPFVLILAVSSTELAVDDLTVGEDAIFGAVAMLAAVVVATSIARLIGSARRRRALPRAS